MQFFYGSLPRKIRCGFLVGNVPREVICERSGEKSEFCKGLEENICKRYLCVCLGPRSREVDGIRILPFGEFLSALWAGEYE